MHIEPVERIHKYGPKNEKKCNNCDFHLKILFSQVIEQSATNNRRRTLINRKESMHMVCYCEFPSPHRDCGEFAHTRIAHSRHFYFI